MRDVRKGCFLLMAGLVVTGCASTGSHGAAAGPTTQAAIATAPAATAPSTVFTDYGAPLKDGAVETLTASAVFADPQAYQHKTIRITGTVGPVCEKKGCWMTVVEPSYKEQVFIKFSDPPRGRLVPLEAPGHKAVLEGEFVIAQISEAFAKHLAEDRNATAEEIAKIVGPQKVYTFKKPAVRIYGLHAAVEPTGLEQ